MVPDDRIVANIAARHNVRSCKAGEASQACQGLFAFPTGPTGLVPRSAIRKVGQEW
jgi:hypothetical protein